MAKIKTGLKLMKYGYGLKMNLFFGILFFVLGLIMCVTSRDEGGILGVLYVVLGPMMLVQITYSLMYANFVGASPKRKVLEITIPDFINTVIALLGYIVVIVNANIRTAMDAEQTGNAVEAMLVTGLTMAALLFCFGAAYKYFVLSMFFFFLVFMVIYSGGLAVMHRMDLNLGMLPASLICFGIIAIGLVLSGLLRRALYKRPFSSLACGANLRKAMQ